MYDIPANEITVTFANGKKQTVKGNSVKIMLKCLESNLTDKEKKYIKENINV